MNFERSARDVYRRIERMRYIGTNSIDNLYFATVQKSGSQWISAIFNDPRMKRHTGLVRMPQRYYEYGEHVSKFPKGFYIPGLYVSYQTFENFIEKPERYRVIYIFRDPRDLVVSDYYSTLKTHPDNVAVLKLRKRLEGMSKEEGLMYMMKYNDKFATMRSWVELGADDPNILFMKFEELTQSPVENFKKMLSHCDIKMSDGTLESILNDYSKSKMRERDLERRSDKSESHYRFKASSHSGEFTEAHYLLFREITGNLLDVLGYT